jgi:DNA-binding MarR family transcriptional regulator
MTKHQLSEQEESIRKSLEQSAGYLLGRASTSLRQRYESKLADLKLSLYEYVCLRLVSMEASLNQGSLGHLYGIDKVTMVALIDKLEAKDLLSRKKNPKDRRSYILHLTPKGIKVLARAKRIVNKEQESFLSVLGNEQWESMRQALVKLVFEQG